VITGAIAGNILGAFWGERSIPLHWLDGLELRDVIATVGDDLANHQEGVCDPQLDWDRYPGW
jgi:ADP-ribosylglycohydrolase